MIGLVAIQQANGWVIAGIGVCIVLTGLSVLAFLVTLLPRLCGEREKKATPREDPPAEKEAPKVVLAPERVPEDLAAASMVYKDWTQDLGETFSLVDLHRKCNEIKLPHPHLSISRFREAGFLVSCGDGRFSWRPQSE
jgi:Na+-transporting methylmalonyl-CoA/oxaloacetate decarboxylase gamma subunit